ncbi:hypothetical protein MMC28_006739 [Mycoblastus sanguinarius]|nr:hypothetical protein [Mycoblastus sanguinarius]
MRYTCSQRGRIWLPSQVTTSYAGKTVLIAGANSSLGYEAALKYAQLDASTIILAVRKSRERELRQHRRVSRKVEAEIDSLGGVVLNSGIVGNTHEVFSTMWEKQLRVAIVATILLVTVLIPNLAAPGSVSASIQLEIVSLAAPNDGKSNLHPMRSGYTAEKKPNSYEHTSHSAVSKLFTI